MRGDSTGSRYTDTEITKVGDDVDTDSSNYLSKLNTPQASQIPKARPLSTNNNDTKSKLKAKLG